MIQIEKKIEHQMIEGVKDIARKLSSISTIRS